MDFYSASDYKTVLRERVKAMGAEREGYRLKNIATRIPVQYTYLSKALRDPKTHLNEDHLFSLCRILELLPDEVDYIFLLRSFATTSDPNRRNYLMSLIDRKRRERDLNAERREFKTDKLQTDMAYLFDPTCLLVHVCLFIPEYQQNPRKLCADLGMTPHRLQTVLKKLVQIGFIECDEYGSVRQVHHSQIHYGTEHPLMRVHQSLLRQMCATKLNQIQDDSKFSMMTTFSSEPAIYDEIQKKFRTFISDVEKLVTRSKSKNTYQLNFDLFRWI